MFAGTFGRVPFAARLAGLAIGDPMLLLGSKPFKRRQLVYDLPFRRLAFVNDRTTVETIMLDRDGQFPKSAVVYELLAPLIGNGVFGQPGGAAVKETRRLMARALAAVEAERVASVADAISREYMEGWFRIGSESAPIGADISRMTVDIVSECTMGGRFDIKQSERFTELFSIYHSRAKPVLLMLARNEPRVRREIVREAGLDRIGEEMRVLIRERFLERACEPAPFRDALLNEVGPAQDASERALDEMAVMLLAGHETTASTLSWLMFELAGNTRLQEDAADAMRGLPTFTFRDCKPDEMISALTNEVLRLYPPIGFFLRENAAAMKLQDVDIPAGSLVLVAPRTLHRHSEYWEGPDDFRPQRWLGRQPERTAFLPFGMGARICPGSRFAATEMRVIVEILLRNAVLSPVEGKDPKPLWNLTSRPHPDLCLSVTRREVVQ